MTALNLALMAELSSGGTAMRGEAGTAGGGESATGSDQFARLMQQQGHAASRAAATARAGTRTVMMGDRSRSTAAEAATDSARSVGTTLAAVTTGQTGAAGGSDPTATPCDEPAATEATQVDAIQAPADLAQWLAQLGMLMPGSVPPTGAAGAMRLSVQPTPGADAAEGGAVTVRGRTDGDARFAGGTDTLALAGAGSGKVGLQASGASGAGRDDGRAERWQETRGRLATMGVPAQAGAATTQPDASGAPVAGADRSGSGSEGVHVGAAGDPAQAQAASQHLAAPPHAASATAVTAASGVEVQIRTPVSDPGFGSVVMSRIGDLAANGVQQAELHLNPAEMGPIVVRIAVEQGLTQVDFQAAHAATRDLLEQSLSQLAQSLQDDGLTLGNSSVSSLPEQGGASQGGYGSSDGARDWAGSWSGSGQGGQSAGRDDSAGRWSAATGRGGWSSDSGEAAGPAPRPAVRSTGVGQLDLYA